MSDRTTSVVSQEAQSPATVQDHGTPATEPTPAPETPPPATDATAAGPAPDPTALLRQFGAAARSAATATLRMGELAAEYITARMLQSDACQRDAAVRVLSAAWQEHSDSVVTQNRVNDLVRLAAAWGAFNAATGYKPGRVAVRVVREFGQCVERDTAQRAEAWRIVPVLEQDARALWAEITGKGLTGEEAAAAVAALLQQHTAAVAKELAARAAAPGATAEDKAAASRAAEDADKAAGKAARKAAKAPTDKPATAATTAKDGVQAPKPESATRDRNVLATLAESAKAGTAKDYAALLAAAVGKADDPLALVYELAAVLVGKSNTPDDTLAALLNGAKTAGSLSKPGTRAVDAALVCLASKPVAVAKAG